MLPKRYRLPRYGFVQLQKLSRAHSEHLTLSYGSDLGVDGFAIIVPKKAAKRAVDRHLLKRRLRALLTPYLQPGRTVIIAAKADTLTTPYTELEAEVATLFSKAFR